MKSKIAAISYNSFVHYKVLEGSGNTNNFLVFLNKLFERLPEPGYTLIMDNVKFHHSPAVQEAVQNAGHTIKFLPAYSPFFNPIEFLFSQWKKFVIAANPRIEEQLLGAIATVNQRINANHINNYFSHVNRNSLDCVQGATVFN